MKSIIYLAIGILFGIVMIKSEAASWFRIYEMFRFDAIHMYGIIGSALVLGVLIVKLIKRNKLKSFFGEQIQIPPKEKSISRYLIGGIIFGLGWALVGVCPGPMFVLVGAGYLPVLIVIASALVGTLIYGILRNKLPH